MLTLGGLALVGSALYGTVKVVGNRRSNKPKRPAWLREPQFVTAVATAKGTATKPLRNSNVVIETPTTASVVGLANYAIYTKQGRQLAISALTGATALIHIVLGLQAGIPLFVWNGAGFIMLLAGKYVVPQLAPYRQEVNNVMLAYTGTTIVAYFLSLGPTAFINPLGLTTKLIEVGLVSLLWQEEEAG